ncbi:MAG: hypothetical protein HYW34_03530 [Candidatus Brennerbacteria bacterium]|nr:hypothetical protein [Candidatus Brennerbacteria bacterium]
MRKAKKIFAVFVILGGFILSIFFIRDAVNNKAVSQLADLGSSAPTEGSILLNTNFENTLTGAYIKKLTENLETANPNGFPIINNELTPNVPDTSNVNQWLKQEADNITIETLKPAISDQELIISDDQSPNAVSVYISQYNIIFEKNFNSLPANINLNVDSSTFDDFIKLINWVSGQYKKINKELLVLPAPKNILNFHKGLIQNNAAEAALYDMVVNYQKDPVKTMMVIPLRNEIIKEKQIIQADVTDLLKNLNSAGTPTN